jgi:hypothetical protein
MLTPGEAANMFRESSCHCKVSPRIFLVLVLYPLAALSTTVTSVGGVSVGFGAGIIPGPGPVATAAGYALAAHPTFSVGHAGVKAVGAPFVDASGLLGPDMHTSTGEGSVTSSVAAIGGGNLAFSTIAVAKATPGLAENLPIAFSTVSLDPLIIGPGFGTLSLDAFLLATSMFSGIPAVPSVADDPRMTLRVRVAPGAISDPETFFGNNPDAIDLYTIQIAQANASGLIVPTVTLGSSNALFTLSFDDPTSVIENRVVGAFTGTAGEFRVLSDALLLGMTVQPEADLTYTFGVSQESFAPDVEVIPEPSSYVLFGIGALSVLSYRIRLRKCQD